MYNHHATFNKRYKRNYKYIAALINRISLTQLELVNKQYLRFILVLRRIEQQGQITKKLENQEKDLFTPTPPHKSGLAHPQTEKSSSLQGKIEQVLSVVSSTTLESVQETTFKASWKLQVATCLMRKHNVLELKIPQK